LENNAVPKLIVLFHGEERAAGALAEHAAAGARSIRFTEVDVRALGPSAGERKVIESTEQLRDYDGVLLVNADGSPSSSVRTLMAEMASADQLPNMVFGVIGGGSVALDAVAKVGGIIVSELRGANANERAERLGARMAKVIGWVRHVLKHEVSG
jgi:hypothetical protein